MEEQRAFGSYLRRERELRQIPLYEVAEATKIPIGVLENLEHGDWGVLPAEVFVRGFIRSYARHVGFSSEDACTRYGDILERLKQQEQSSLIEPVGDSASDTGGGRRFGVALFVIILLIIATITLSLIWRGGASADTHADLSPSAAQSASSSLTS